MNTKIIKQLFLVTAALVFTACSENLLEQTYSSSKGRSATVQLNISTAEEQGEAPATRAIPSNSVTEGTVSDFWLLEYGADGRLLQAGEKPVVEYFTKEDLVAMNNKLNIQLPNEGSNDSYKCVMIANTHNRSFFDRANPSLYDTLKKLKELTKDVTSINDTYNYDTKDLYLSCVTNVDKSTTKLECMFYRNVAKLTFSVENKAGSGMKITGIEVCNVPNKMAYADRLYDGGTDKMASGADLFNMEREPIEINEGDRHSFIYYLPRNCQGVDNGITDVKKKNKSDLHKSATCVKVYATENSTLNPYCYTFYLGKNMTNDFNVRSNFHYTLPINISTPGDADSDSRVEDLDAVKLEANCIIVNDPKRVYSIQPFKRCSIYWQENKKLYPDLTDYSLMTEDYEWKARILWNDISEQNPIVFCDRNGNNPTDVFYGKGKEKMYFKLRGNSQQYGNAVISVDPKKSTTALQHLWSWHLWLTNYNPDVAETKKPWQDGVYKINVGNGAVYRYASGAKIFPTLWDTDKYQNKYIMDRNLGATTNKEPSANDNIKKSGGLFYQFGRKEPFVRNEIKLYTIKNSGITIEHTDPNGKLDYIAISTQPTNVYYNSTRSIHMFYTREKGDWITKNPYPTDAKWNNPTWYQTESGKSFFDPCPEGWKIPDDGCWNIVSKTTSVTGDNASISKNYINGTMTKGKGYNFPIDAIGGKITTFYPFTGYRDTDGTVTKESNYGAYWTTSPMDTDPTNRSLAFRIQDTGNIDMRAKFYRAMAASVRCVQE